ncbi:flagellar basal body rod protein FlgB [Elioraea rosea]|uniref:Flagellar basal body rod protein FlgB n=1 Tax=Ancylomarina salipaludis TaxID=2501299 RepID=A0A4Q1JIH8_9BACT|nr:flagellar basal body protein [Elioraea rosea]RXQ86893.1 flagellar biosynthesis protein FlgB [Ancylomarina salipaludis]
MDLGRLGFFKVAEQRLGWLDRRQDVLAQNIANANTPGYAARDLAPFAKVLARNTGPGLVRTSAQHIVPASAGAHAARPERLAQERTHDGNAVQIEDQVARVAETESQHELTVGLYRKYMGLFRIALGRGG